MKNLVIFGATGMTGQCALAAALKEGWKVRVLVRDPKKLPADAVDKVEVVQGDVTSSADVNKAVAGQDAVCVALGTRSDLSPTTVLSDGLKNILSAMVSNGVKAVSVCISAFLFFEPDKVPPRFKDLTDDHRRMHEILKQSDLNWIAVFPPHIADKPGTGIYTVVHDKNGPTREISKHDLGEFLIKCLNMPEHYKQVCGLSNVVSS